MHLIYSSGVPPSCCCTSQAPLLSSHVPKWEHQDHVLHAACCKESAQTVWYALGMQTNPQLRAALAARFSSQAESGHSSTTNGGLPPEGPSLEERRTYQKRAGEDSSSEPPAPIRVDVSDSGAIHAFLSASQSNYEVSLSLPLTQVGKEGLLMHLILSRRVACLPCDRHWCSWFFPTRVALLFRPFSTDLT